ncbi:MAG: SMC-Scp complex subunit ScpB [Candidatus Omnitrophota bacterium]
MENSKKIKNIIEALLIVSENGLSLNELKSAITNVDNKDIKEGLELLREEYGSEDRAFNIAEIAEKYRIVTKPEYLEWINNLYKKETERLSSPALETLAIIAYKQPVTRAEAESVRGVGVGGVLKTLLDKDLIQVKGRKDVIGRPLLYATTDKFLKIFGLNSLNDLPMLRDFTEEDLEYGKPQEIVEMEGRETMDEGRGTMGEGRETMDEGRGTRDEEEINPSTSLGTRESESQRVIESEEATHEEKES